MSPTRRPSLLAALLALTGALLLEAPALAHDGHAGRMARADELIAESPDDGEAWLARSRLHRLVGSLKPARRDLEVAALRDADPRELVLEQVRLADAFGASQVGTKALARHLTRDAGHGRAWELAAERAVAAGQTKVAARAFLRATETHATPSPDLFGAAAETCLAAGRTEDAVAVLRRGVQRLGATPFLVLRQVELERARGRTDAAIAHLAQLPDNESWQALRGDLLLDAGRRAAAREAYTRARSTLAATPRRRRLSPAGQELAAHLEQQLAALAVADSPDAADR